MKKTIKLNERELRRLISESVENVLRYRDIDLDEINSRYRHVEICRHPLKDEYFVFIKSIPGIPPYFGTLGECVKSADKAEKKCEDMLAKRKIK